MKHLKTKAMVLGIFSFMLFSTSCNSNQDVGESRVKITYTTPTRLVYDGREFLVAEDRVSLLVDGMPGLELKSTDDKTHLKYNRNWGRKIRVRLPKGYRQIYESELVLRYPDKETVWIGCDDIQPDSSYLNVCEKYGDGIYHPSPEYIDSLIYRARLRSCTAFRSQGYAMETVLMRQGKIFSGGKPGYTFTGPKPPLFYLCPAMKDRRAILHVKDGVFVLAYNIKERDYPLFEAYICDTFVVCSRYMDIVDSETLEYERRGAFPNVIRSQYMEERFYREIPTVTPPDSARIVEDAWRGTGLIPEQFRTR